MFLVGSEFKEHGTLLSRIDMAIILLFRGRSREGGLSQKNFRKEKTSNVF